MKVLILIVINILAVSAYKIRQIDGIIGTVRQIEFDSNQNTYLVAYNSNNDHLYKLDKNNSIILEQSIYDLYKIIINKRNDVFIFNIDTSRDYTLNYISIKRLKSDSDSLESLFKYHYRPVDLKHYFDPSYFIDSDDNIFFNTDSGVAILKTVQTTPIAVSGLGDFTFNLHAEDVNGNVYLANNQSADDSFAVVYKETKQNLIPNGVIIPNNVRNTSGLIIWNNRIVFSGLISNNVSTVVHFQTAFNGIIAQQYTNHTVLNGSSDRLFWLSQYGEIAHLYYYNRHDNEVVRIEETLNATALFKGGQHIIDSSGNLFLAFYKTDYNFSESQVLVLKSTEKTFRKINISLDKYIVSMVLDKNDNLWVLTDALYIILKDADYAIKISESPLTTSAASLLKIKENTGEVFIATGGGLFVCTNE